MLERPVDKITEKDGIHYYENLPILNYDILKIPEQIDEVITEEIEELSLDETSWEMKMIPSIRRKTEHPVNRTCTPTSAIYDGKYKELYACVIDYNKRTQEGYFVGFDVLGKILVRNFCLKGLTDDNNVRWELSKDMFSFDWKRNKKFDEREKECGFLNFDYRLSKAGKLTCKYDSIWKG